MLRKIASLFFEEEEDIVEDEEREVKGATLPPIAAAPEKKATRIDAGVQRFDNEPAKLPTISETAAKTATRIDLGPQTVQKQKRVVGETKAVYEFQPVISPIFGISDKDKQTMVPQPSEPKQPTRHSPLQTIISPIYGVMKKDDNPDEVSEHVEIPVNPHLEIKNLSLEELIHEESGIKEKTLEQFSLFEENQEV
jgi:hypothetical protein